MLLHCAVICMKCSSASSVICASVICANSFIYASSFISASSAISTNPLSSLSSFFYPSFFPITFITFPVQNWRFFLLKYLMTFSLYSLTSMSLGASHLLLLLKNTFLALSFFFSVPIFMKKPSKDFIAHISLYLDN